MIVYRFHKILKIDNNILEIKVAAINRFIKNYMNITNLATYSIFTLILYKHEY